MRSTSCSAMIALALLNASLRARSEDLPRSVVIRGCSVLDVAGGKMLADRTVVLEGGKIRALGGPDVVVDPPPGATTIAARGKFLIPGLIDAHVHLVHVLDSCKVTGDEARRPDHRSTLDLDNPRAKALLAAISEKGTFVDPTLVVFRNMILLNDQPAYSGHPDIAAVPARLLRHWNDFKARSHLRPGTLGSRRGEFGKYQQLTGRLHRAGVPLLVGTDAPEPFVPPGSSMHQELELLVESGLTPAEALRCGTLYNARALGQADRLGTIVLGMLADLVLLDANPLEAITNTRAIHRVIRGGLVLDPGYLLKLVPSE